ncbi:MAG: hypothetical protein NTZ90_10780 [Proteobacteria bacterium]|nr:hypothetical protein [Pseudomonadota bacterium]
MNEHEVLGRFVRSYGGGVRLVRRGCPNAIGTPPGIATIAAALALVNLYLRPMQSAEAWLASVSPPPTHDWRGDGFFVDGDDEISRLENDFHTVTKVYRRP